LRNNFKVISKFVLACPAVLRFRAGSLDVGDAPASLKELVTGNNGDTLGEVVIFASPENLCQEYR
jgi:hypothetical protein